MSTLFVLALGVAGVVLALTGQLRPVVPRQRRVRYVFPPYEE